MDERFYIEKYEQDFTNVNVTTVDENVYIYMLFLYIYVVLERAQYFTDRLTLSFSLQFLSGAFICILIVPVLIIWDILTV